MIERYDFSLTTKFKLGKPCSFTMTEIPQIKKIFYESVFTNPPSVFFIRDLKVTVASQVIFQEEDAYCNDISRSVGGGFGWKLHKVADGSNHSPVYVSGQYTGLIPNGFKEDYEFIFVVSLKGTTQKPL